MNPTPLPRTRFPSRRPPPRRATARRGRPGSPCIGEWGRVGGTSGVVRLSMSGTTGSLVGRYGYDLVWMCGSLDADTFPEEGFAETTNLVAYTVFREPLSPWTNVWTNAQNAWTNALEFALATAGASGSVPKPTPSPRSHNIFMVNMV